jgi:arsenate reductase
MSSVQIFGLKNSPATRAAERFFKERRVAIHMVDLKQKAMAGGEIGRFIERFGLAGLLDSDGNAYIDAGLKYYKLESTDM